MLSKGLGVSKSKIVFVAGKSGRDKRLEIAGMDDIAIEKILNSVMKE